MIYIANSMYEEALSELENEKKLTGLDPVFKPVYDDIRSDPRFIKLLIKFGLEL